MNNEFIEQLNKYESKWVALIGSDEKMEIVAVGEDAADAAEQAADNGYTETTLLKVLPSGIAYI